MAFFTFDHGKKQGTRYRRNCYAASLPSGLSKAWGVTIHIVRGSRKWKTPVKPSSQQESATESKSVLDLKVAEEHSSDADINSILLVVAIRVHTGMLQSIKLCILLHTLCHLFVSSWHCLPSDFTRRRNYSHRPDPLGTVHRATSSSDVTPSRPLPRLVLLIPAYNEEDRIPNTLQSYQDFFEKSIWECEILVIDDGSQDETASIVNSFPGKIPIQCVSLPTNQGKGGALARGIQVAADQNNKNSKEDDTLILTVDADGSGELVYLETLVHSLEDILTQQDGSVNWSYPAMVTGNRNYNIFTARGITRWGFQTCVKLIMNDLRVRDSQCGYKLMTLPAATRLYRDLHLQRWSHDVEVLFRAKLYDIPIREVPIEWKDKDGSKVVESGVVRVSIEMLLDVLRLRWEYSVTGNWNWKRADK